MGDFSVPPLEMLLHSQQKGYVALHIEQGVPILDRDLNLQADLALAGMRALFDRYVGSGVPPESDSFAIQALLGGEAEQDFRIAAGKAPCVVGGIEVGIPQSTTYTKQPGAAALTTPTDAQPDPRTDTVFLDVFLLEEDGTGDPTLANTGDVGMRTSVRVRPAWSVRVAEGAPMPQPAPGHHHFRLAELYRPRGKAAIGPAIADLRRRLVTVAALEQRVQLLERVLLLPAFASPAFEPPSGRLNQLVTLKGTNFTVGGTSGITVLFGTRPAEVVGTSSATQLQARVPADLLPAGASFVDVQVTVRTTGGEVVSTDTFRAARDVLKPTLAVPPFSPPNGSAGDTVELRGDNFNWPPVVVKFDPAGSALTAPMVGAVSHTRLTVKVPVGLVTAGFKDVPIQVTTASGTVTSDSLFRVNG